MVSYESHQRDVVVIYVNFLVSAGGQPEAIGVLVFHVLDVVLGNVAVQESFIVADKNQCGAGGNVAQHAAASGGATPGSANDARNKQYDHHDDSH